MIKNRMEMRGQGGFTLIELLVVIAILAVLGGVVVFAVGGINDTSQDAACDMDKRTLRTAVQAYRASEKGWPATQTVLVDKGFLDSESAWHDFTAPSSAASSQAVTIDLKANSPC